MFIKNAKVNIYRATKMSNLLNIANRIDFQES